MATILEFRRSEEAAARIKKTAEGALGEIIIFPGVRIERRACSDVPRTTGQTNRAEEVAGLEANSNCRGGRKKRT
jgi:hypothetical protein